MGCVLRFSPASYLKRLVKAVSEVRKADIRSALHPPDCCDAFIYEAYSHDETFI